MFFEGREDKSKKRQKSDQTGFIFFKTTHFEHILKKSTHSVFIAHSIYNRGLKALSINFFLNWTVDHQVGLWKKAIFRGPTSSSMV